MLVKARMSDLLRTLRRETILESDYEEERATENSSIWNETKVRVEMKELEFTMKR